MAYRLADQLTQRYGADVVVLMTRDQHRSGRDFTELSRVRLVIVDRVDEKALLQAEIQEASGIALTVQDDVGNIHIALQARDLLPNLRVVVRMYNTHLGQAIERLLGDCRVLSDAEIAAPALVATALGEVAATPVTVAGRTLIVAKRNDVPERDVVCGLADTSTLGDPRLLPAGESDLVLAEARSAEAVELINTVRVPGPAPKHRWWRLRAARAMVRALVSRKLDIAFITVILTLLVSGALLAFANESIGGWDGFYLTLVNAFGGPQEHADFSRFEQVLQILIGIAGLAVVPLVTALIVEGMVNARIAVTQGKLVQPLADHVVVVGLGGVGTRVIRLLADRGMRVVAIDNNPQARGVPLANELGIPVIVGDASRETTLRSAGVDRCRALMAVASTDVINLEAALHGRNLQPSLRVLVRLFDGDLSRRVRTAFNLKFTRSVSYVAAPAFAEALMDRDVIGTISVERRVLLLAQIVVGPGSRLAGKRVSDADEAGEARVIALTELGEPRPMWNPAEHREIQARDLLTVVCTRDGLSRLVRRAAAPQPVA